MVRAALVQFSGHESKEINVQKAEDLARQAAGNGARIICLPELSTTIYFCFERDKKWFETAEPIPGPAVNRLAKVAKETGTVIVYPLYENDNGTLYNTAAVLGPDGKLIGKYRKMSIPQIIRTVKPGETPADERFYFAPGNLGFPVFDTPFGVKIGILICYDRHFPEAARILGLKGAHLMLVPTATYREWIREVWEIELRGHAIANMFYVGGVNKVGKDVGGPPIATTSAVRSSSTRRATSWAGRATSRTRSSTPTSTPRRARTRATSGASSSSGAPTPTARS